MTEIVMTMFIIFVLQEEIHIDCDCDDDNKNNADEFTISLLSRKKGTWSRGPATRAKRDSCRLTIKSLDSTAKSIMLREDFERIYGGDVFS